MMKIYICPHCGWIRMVSRRKDVECHKCGNEQMRLTNLEFERYSNMSEKERQDYVDAWLYIHNRNKGK
ncbi:MAG: DNA-directed RNA polymerase subunit M [Agathobacter sp.]|nr:DNA-directed RNA polymerase subunit M [Agathobacter sp.]